MTNWRVSQMHLDKEKLKYYKMVLELEKTFKKEKPYFVKSVFIYGSVSRGEMIPGISDLDVMIVLNKETLTKEETQLLNKINKRVYEKYPIHMTFRLRNLTEINREDKTTSDFIGISIWNYYIDAWYIYGSDLSKELKKKIKRSPELIKKDLSSQILELRKALRALYSVHEKQLSTTTTHSQTSTTMYKIGDILGELSRIVCWIEGIKFKTTQEATLLAGQILRENLFKEAIKIKTSKVELDFFKVYENMETIFEKLLKKDYQKAENIFKNQKFRERTTVGLLLKNKTNQKYLILKNSEHEDYWTLPKGGKNENETITEALKRELFEETQIKDVVVKGKKIHLNHYYFDKEDCLVKVTTILYAAETDKKDIVLSHEHTDYKWVNKKEFLDYSKHTISLLISEYLN
jgi:bis(5'-nucleosidyl)-tetraphosphatase